MDDTASLLALADRMLWVTALVAAPVLLASLAVGLVIGIIQAATSVSEQTLTFVPKLIVIALVTPLSFVLNKLWTFAAVRSARLGLLEEEAAADRVHVE